MLDIDLEDFSEMFHQPGREHPDGGGGAHWADGVSPRGASGFHDSKMSKCRSTEGKQLVHGKAQHIGVILEISGDFWRFLEIS